jgi:hypothetical protein
LPKGKLGDAVTQYEKTVGDGDCQFMIFNGLEFLMLRYIGKTREAL